MTFALHPRLAAGAFAIGETQLNLALLKDDCRWPWVLLIPKVANARELHDLSDAQAQTLMAEIRAVSMGLAGWPGVQKINVGAIGNQVAQLHVHVVARWEGDAAWPDPVWGKAGKTPYAEPPADLIAALKSGLRAGS